jgi:hypothetical protein
MDIHFCDLCGVRVTDVDLRGGHGIRKQYDVICATCLELGHGKEWLASHQRGKSALSASQPAAAALAATASNKQAPIVTIARDRVRTFEDGDESPAVAPQVLAAEEPEDGIATSELSTAEVVAEAAAAEAAKASAKHAEANPFAAAASSFSALAGTSRRADAAADVDENGEQGEGLSDESTASPIIADDQDDAKSDESSESPFGFKEDSDAVAQKDETLPGDRDSLVDKPADKSGKKSSSASASFKKSGSANKSSAANSKSNNKASAARSGKGPAKKGSKNKNTLMLSLLSAGILLMVGLIVIKALKPPKKLQETIHIDMSQDLKDAIKDAKLSATISYKAKDLDKMKEAKGKIQAVQSKIYAFEKETKSQNKDVWDEGAYGRYLESVDWPNTQSLIRILNDELVKQHGDSSGPEH